VAACQAWRLASLTQAIVSDGRTVSKQQLRAYLNNLGMFIDYGCGPATKEFHAVHADAKNGGSTPAYDVRMWLAQRQFTDSSPSSYDIPDDEMTASPMIATVLPGSTEYFFWAGDFVSRKIVESMQDGSHKTLYVGKITFRDIFTDRRTVDFCYTLSMERGCRGTLPNTFYARCPIRNGEREQQKDQSADEQTK
jgi:hypothetical protein